ncbi:MAG: gamma-glutamyl-gamma-aminobutyrate hydrolase family protein [Balneolales bacterium]|nr:gamma-glutamyl-gamma-aminobutyrate hydrolase family protein [Balneolales bacterium]
MTKNKRKPVIGVTGPDKGGFVAWIFTWLAVWRAGGIARRIRPNMWRKIPVLDGLILGGGADISPELYGAEDLKRLKELSEEKPRRSWIRFVFFFVSFGISLARNIFSLGHNAKPDPERDRIEKELLEIALRENLPVLGICRGAQFINVHFGGTLHQDITEFYNETPKADTIYPRKDIILEPESSLAAILETTRTKVNSLHNQAAAKPGDGVWYVAKEPNGVVQAIELKNNPYVIGLQWHPEYLPQIDSQQRLFRVLVRIAKETREKKG